MFSKTVVGLILVISLLAGAFLPLQHPVVSASRRTSLTREYSIQNVASHCGLATQRTTISNLGLETQVSTSADPLTISISPLSVTMQEHQVVQFAANVSGGTPPYTYLWYIDDGEVGNSNSSVLYFGPSSVGMHSVRAEVTDFEGASAVSQWAQAIVELAQLTLAVSISPISATITVGDSVWYTATLTDTQEPYIYTYHWYSNDTLQQSTAYYYWSYQPAEPGVHFIYVNVTDTLGYSAVSEIAQLVVLRKPLAVTITPAYVSLIAYDTVTFDSKVTGGFPPYTYQWYLNNETIPSGFMPSWTFNPTMLGTYYVSVNVTDSLNTSVNSVARAYVSTQHYFSVPNPDEITEATIEGGSIATVDPAASYDTASSELIMNMYDTLVSFDSERMDRYLPSLALVVPNATNGLIVHHDPPIVSAHTGLKFYYTYYFQIRTGVSWQNSSYGTVTPADVEYTFERGMVLEAGDNPQWMFYEPLLNGATMTYIDGRDINLTDPVEQTWVGWAIDEAVESNSTHVWFNLAFPGAYAPFMQILTQPWSSILCKQWCLDLGRASNWNGDWGVDHTAYLAYHFPAVAPLDDPEPAVMGSGPFILAHLDQTHHYWDAYRFDEYWRGWPLDWPIYGNSGPGGYINHLTVTWAYDWNARSAMFLKGEIDFCAVPRQYIGQMLGQPGVRCTYPLPSLACDAYSFQFNIPSTSPYGPILPPGTFNESGVPTDFFGNTAWGVHVRKAFASIVDYDLYIQSVFLGEAVHPATAIIPALPYYDPTVKGYSYNLSRAVEELKQVPGLWDTGFSLKILYNMGSRTPVMPELIVNGINSLNPKFHVQAVGLDWASYLAASSARQLPVFAVGWLADYPDAHDFAYPYYYTSGNFAARAHYSNATMDALIDEGIRTPDGSERAAIYSQIQQLAIDDCPNIVTASAVGRHFERNWVCGWYYNPAYPGVYAANVWKWYYVPQALNETAIPPTSDCLPFDSNYDGKVNMYDIGAVAASFGAIMVRQCSSRWNFRCDLNDDRKINMQDIGMVARYFGKTAIAWIPPH